MSKTDLTHHGLLKTAAGAGLTAPTIFDAFSPEAYTNKPTGSSVTLGFNVPRTGPYAGELRAFELAVEHLNGEGDGGMRSAPSSKTLDGGGILGEKVEYVTGDVQTKSDAARTSAKSMIEKDGAVMISGGSSSGPAVVVQVLCQDAGTKFGFPPGQVAQTCYAQTILYAAAVTGVMYVPINPPNYHMAMDFLVLSPVVVAVGGTGSLPGVVLAGFVLGILESFASMVEVIAVISGIDHIIIYLVAIMVLLTRPRGPMGRKGLMEE